MNEIVAFKKLIRCSRTTDLRQVVIFLCKVRCKWEYLAKQLGEKSRYYGC